MNLLGRFDEYWYAKLPPERLAALRIIIGAFGLIYLVVQAGHYLSYARFQPEHFAPIGVVRVLHAPLASSLVYAGFAAAVVSGGLFVVGAWYRLSGPLFALMFLWITSYRNSWGMVFHTDNLVCLHLLVLGFAPAAAAWSRDALTTTNAGAHGRYGWAVRALCWITVAAYVLAGIAKLKNAGLAWIDGEVLRTHIAYDAARKLELGGVHSPIGAYLVRFSWLFGPLSTLSMLLELGAPLALLGRRFAKLWVAGIWSFHLGVIALMAITFVYPVSGCAYVSFFAVERLGQHPIGQRLLRALGLTPAAPTAP